MKNYGLIISKIETHEEGVNHILGSTEVVVNPTGDWMPYLPTAEPQSKNGIETQECTICGTLRAIEEAIYKQTGIRVNYSERYAANMAKKYGILNPYGGADPHRVAELIRNICGNLAEERAPWTDDIKTVEDYYALDLTELIKEGPAWYKDWKLEHRWIFNGGSPMSKRVAIKDALTKGPCCVSAAAWYQAADGTYFKPEGVTDNHWVNLVQAEGAGPYKVFDSYDPYVKTLHSMFDFALGKVYFLTPKPHLFLKDLGFQMMDTEVPYLQKALQSLGYPIPHAVTSVYGTETRTAVWKFQLANGINDDGSHFGPKTRQALNVALNPTAPFGGSLITYLQALFSGV